MERKPKSAISNSTSQEVLLGPGQHSIAVWLVVQGQERLLRGQGAIERDSELGDVLRVRLSVHGEDSELLLAKKHWPKKLDSGAAFGCEYVILIR